MAAVAPPADQSADLLKNLSLDSQTKTLEIPEPTKKASVDAKNAQIQPNNKSVTPLITDFMDPSLAYFPNSYPSPYYYGGYDGSNTDWDEYSRYMNPDGVDMTHGVYGENGSLMYGYGYNPYGPYSPAASPVPTVGQDGQFYGAQHYQYPSPYFPPITPTGGPFSAAGGAPAKGEIATSAPVDQPLVSVDPTKQNSNVVKGNNGSVKPTPYVNSGLNANGVYGKNGYQDPRYGFGGVHSPMSWIDSSVYSDPQNRNNSNNAKNQNLRPHSNLMNPRPLSTMNTGYLNRMYPNKLYQGQYGNSYRSGYGFGSNAWLTVDNKYKPRGRTNGFYGYNNENGDGLNELNRGPRARSTTTTKNQKSFTPITIAVKGQNITLPAVEESKELTESKEGVLTLGLTTPDRELYNKEDFEESYADAKFFVIKSYSEDDVHKSIKYNVWASTQNGNKKLDAAYQEAQSKPEKCPIFLFFSVNTSGQFVGVAEMVGPVDFEKSLEYWQQDKWIGCFPVKWHIVKDLPNSLLKHIILENNENKPVTNSRDTQEVKLDQGLQVLKIFKDHSSKQCILDDFEFYEDRQKRIQEKKAKQQQFQKQAWETTKPSTDVINDVTNEVKPVVNVQENVVANVLVEKKVVENGC